MDAAEPFSIGRSRFLMHMRRVLLLPSSFIDNNTDHYFSQAWLRKSTEVVTRQRRNID